MRGVARGSIAVLVLGMFGLSFGTAAGAGPSSSTPTSRTSASNLQRAKASDQRAPRTSARSGGRVPVQFVRHHVVDVQRLAGEPAIRIDSDDNVYVTGPIGAQYAHSFLWKSEDNGHSFDLLRTFPFQRPAPSLGSGDAEVVVLPAEDPADEDPIVWSDMVALASLANAASFDGGNDFPPEYWNEAATDPGADRQWLDWMPVGGGPRIYQWFDKVGTGNTVIYSDDYGQTWTQGQTDIDASPSNPGNIAADPVHKKLYVAYNDNNKAKIAVGNKDATNFKPTVAGTGKGDVGTLFVTVDTDTAGNVYVAWADRGTETKAGGIYMAVSTDQGKTFHKRQQMNPPGIKTGVFPWVVAGDPGRAWVTWYGSRKGAAAPDNRGPWNVYAAQTLNALGSHPTSRTVKVNDRAMHDNEICLDGIGCSAGQAEDRNLLDDFVAQIDSRGMLHVAYNDSNNQLTASTDKDAGGAFAIHAQQNSGPSLYKKVGSVVPRPKRPKVTSLKKKSGSLRVKGFQYLPPGNWATDFVGDAGEPRHGPGCPCANNPELDLTSAWMQNKGDNVVAHLRLKNLPPAEQVIVEAGGKSVVYQVVFWLKEKVYFAQLEVAGEPRAYAGEPGFIPNQAGVGKIAIYSEDPSLTVPIDYTFKDGKNGHITLSIPKSVIGNPKKGDRLYRIHPLVHTLEGTPGAEALMAERDGTEARFWNVGDPRLPRGHVELSIDDRNFRHPIRARLVGYPGKGWARALGLKSLSPGRHTIFVRERIGPFTSRIVEATFKK
jgi:hypothetical protein